MKPAAIGSAVVIGVIAAGALWVLNCSGPRPQVEDVRLEEPEQQDHPYRVEVVVRNKGRNEGEVTVLFELVSQDDGSIYRVRENVELKAREMLTVVTEIDAPKGTYEPRGKVSYPPE